MRSNKNYNISFDFSDVYNVKFKCLNNCALCCNNQYPILTSTEVNRIINHMKTFNENKIQYFISQIFDSFGSDESTKNYIEIFHKVMTSFWNPLKYCETNDNYIVLNYTVCNINSGKCMFLDPAKLICLIYPSRPYTCRLYPVSFESYGNKGNKIVIDYRNCPGVGIGDGINVHKIQSIQRESFKSFIKDWNFYEKYIKDRGLTILNTYNNGIFNKCHIMHSFGLEESKNQNYINKDSKFLTKKIIEPLVEYGLIKEHPLIKLHNEKIDCSRKLY